MYGRPLKWKNYTITVTEHHPRAKCLITTLLEEGLGHKAFSEPHGHFLGKSLQDMFVYCILFVYCEEMSNKHH